MATVQIKSPYVTRDEGEAKYGRERYNLDVQRFARDLAKVMGAEYVEPRKDFGDSYYWADINIPGSILTVVINHPFGKANREHVEICARGPDDLQRFWDCLPRDERFPTAKFSTARPLADIAKGIRTKVLEPSEKPLALLQAAKQRHEASKSGLAEAIAKLAKRFPQLTIRPRDSGTEAEFWTKSEVDCSVSGRIYSDGRVYIERVSMLDPAHAAIVLAAFIE